MPCAVRSSVMQEKSEQSTDTLHILPRNKLYTTGFGDFLPFSADFLCWVKRGLLVDKVQALAGPHKDIHRVVL